MGDRGRSGRVHECFKLWLSHDYFEMQDYRNTFVAVRGQFVSTWHNATTLPVRRYYDKPRMSYAPTHPLRLHCDPPTISPRPPSIPLRSPTIPQDPTTIPQDPATIPHDHPRLPRSRYDHPRLPRSLTTALRMCHACATHACGCFQPDKRTRLEPTTSVASKIS